VGGTEDKRGETHVWETYGVREETNHSRFASLNLLPSLPTHVKKAPGHAPSTYVPHKICHSITAPMFTPAAALVPVPDKLAQFSPATLENARQRVLECVLPYMDGR